VQKNLDLAARGAEDHGRRVHDRYVLGLVELHIASGRRLVGATSSGLLQVPRIVRGHRFEGHSGWSRGVRQVLRGGARS